MKILITLLISSLLASCAMFKGPNAPAYETDPVCGMKVDISDAYTYKYNNKKYYFDNYNCKNSFKMNPKRFLENNCADKTSP